TEDLKDEAENNRVCFDMRRVETEMLVATRGSSLTAALENILRNAIKYSTEGGRISVTTGQDGDCGQIQVTDSGNGVPETELEAIFRPFYRTDEARSRESGGFGLGLAIAQRTVAQHGGSIKAFNA